MIRGLILGAALFASATAVADTREQPGVVTTQAAPGATVYADMAGMTLYTFGSDKLDKPACGDDCARIWKPLVAAWIASPTGDWTIVIRADGSRQWAYRGKPLYSFTGDHHPGEVNGEGAANGWHAVVTSRQFLPPGTMIWQSDFGAAFATSNGKTLYVLAELRFNPLGTKRHTGPNLGLAECDDACTKIWKPLTASNNATAGGDWSIVARADGTHQWAYKNWPVFTNIRDSKPGDTFGEGVTTVKGGLSGLSWEVATL